MKRLMAIVALSLLAGLSHAAAWTNGNQVVLYLIWIPTHHGFYVSGPNYHDPEQCGGGNYLYLIDPTLDEKTVDRLYAMLLSASVAGKPLHVRVDGCINGQPKFVGLQLNNS